MADNDPNDMINKLGALTGVIEKATSAFGSFATMLESHLPNWAKGFSGLTDSIVGTNKAVDDATTAVEKHNKQLDVMHGLGRDLADDAVLLARAWNGTNMFEGFAQGAQSAFTSVSAAAQPLSADLSSIIGVVAKVSPEIAKLMGTVGGGADKFISLSNAGQQAEMGFYHLIAASGRMNDTFKNGTDVLSTLTLKTTGFVQEMEDAAEANGTTMSKTLELANALSTIPDVLGKMTNLTDESGSALSEMSAIMRVAAGSGQDQSKAIEAVSSAYQNLSGTANDARGTTERGLELFSEMNDLQQKLHISFSDSQGALSKVAQEFRTVGDETAGATQIFEQFGAALKETGLTAKVSADLVGGLIENIEKTTVAQKAFMSRQAGGPGGLQGAFQIEQMLHQGNISGVMNMAMQSARRLMGPHIYTQDEAAASPAAASQFMRQRSILQSGALGVGGGMDDQSASRFMEAMKSGNLQLGKEALTAPKEQAQHLAEQGVSLQRQQYTELTHMRQTSDRSSAFLAAIAFNTLRQVAGTGNKETMAAMGEARARGEAALGKRGEAKDDLTALNEEDLAGREKMKLDDLLNHPGAQMAHSVGRIARGAMNTLGEKKDHPGTMAHPMATEYDPAANHRRAIGQAAMDGAHRPAMHAATVATAAQQAQKVQLEITVSDPNHILGEFKGDDNISISHKDQSGMHPLQTTNNPGY